MKKLEILKYIRFCSNNMAFVLDFRVISTVDDTNKYAPLKENVIETKTCFFQTDSKTGTIITASYWWQYRKIKKCNINIVFSNSVVLRSSAFMTSNPTSKTPIVLSVHAMAALSNTECGPWATSGKSSLVQHNPSTARVDHQTWWCKVGVLVLSLATPCNTMPL